MSVGSSVLEGIFGFIFKKQGLYYNVLTLIRYAVFRKYKNLQLLP